MKYFLPITFCLLGATGQAQFMDDNLQGHYPFSGNAYDNTANDLHGTVYGAELTEDRFGRPYQAYFFDGQDDYIDLGTDNRSYVDQLSYSVWLKMSSSDFGCAIVKYDWNEDKGVLIREREGYPSIEGRDGGNAYVKCLAEEPYLDPSKWYHVVGTIDKNIWRLWVNGKLMQEVDSGNEAVDLSTSANLYVGRLSIPTGEGNYRYFHGAIDDLRIYNDVLDSSEVNDLYMEGICMETITDTVTVEVHDTVTVEVHDTIQVHDTVMVSVTDTLIIETDILSDQQVVENVTLQVYPNPTQNQVVIATEDQTKLDGYQIKIYDSVGALVFEFPIEESMTTLNLIEFGSNGIYHLNLYDPEGTLKTTKKILLVAK